MDVDEGEVVGLLRVKSAEERGEGNWNAGNGVTDDLKRVIKQGRLVGVHVSPTVFFNGIEERGISSSWGREEWEPWLERNVK